MRRRRRWRRRRRRRRRWRPETPKWRQLADHPPAGGTRGRCRGLGPSCPGCMRVECVVEVASAWVEIAEPRARRHKEGGGASLRRPIVDVFINFSGSSVSFNKKTAIPKAPIDFRQRQRAVGSALYLTTGRARGTIRGEDSGRATIWLKGRRWRGGWRGWSRRWRWRCKSIAEHVLVVFQCPVIPRVPCSRLFRRVGPYF